jgi:hypothetical protein
LLDYYCQNGGNLIVSGANIFKSENFLFHSLAVKKNKEISDKNVTEISDNKGLLFNIYRKPNPNSYSVPAPISLAPTQPHTKTLFKYSNGESACIYTNNNNISAICFGFPFESITDQQKRNIVMGEILHTISE